MKQSVARTIEKQELEVIILEEQTSGGRTIIENVIENSEARIRDFFRLCGCVICTI